MFHPNGGAFPKYFPRTSVEMPTTGQFIDVTRALGLLNRVVYEEQLSAEIRALAELLASKLGVAVKIGKEAFYNQLQMPLSEAYDYTGDVMIENMLYRDIKEGISVFIEKRDLK